MGSRAEAVRNESCAKGGGTGSARTGRQRAVTLFGDASVGRNCSGAAFEARHLNIVPRVRRGGGIGGERRSSKVKMGGESNRADFGSSCRSCRRLLKNLEQQADVFSALNCELILSSKEHGIRMDICINVEVACSSMLACCAAALTLEENLLMCVSWA